MDVLPGTRLRAILGRDRVAGEQLPPPGGEASWARASSLSARGRDDGVIEGMERPDRRFVIGVQWHPESFWDQPPGFQPLFEALVNAAR